MALIPSNTKVPIVTIIMPIYKAETTIRKSLDSIIAQTLTDWELVMVDDGSPDTCGRICDEYVAKDIRLHVIHQKNCGVSAARQSGLEAAKGEYIIHVDPDDWVEPQMLEALCNKAKMDDSDMVICDFYSDFGNRIIYNQQRPTSLISHVVLNDMFMFLHGSCCNKLIRRECIEKYKAYFPIGINYCEDVCFQVQLLEHDIKISYLNKAFYHYVQYPSSITNHYTIETLHTQKKYVEFLLKHLPEDSFPIIVSKELVKKLAFRNAVLTINELKQLYPEITSVHDGNLIMRIMYGLAFNGHSFSACLLRALCNMLHGKKRIVYLDTQRLSSIHQ